MKRELNKNTGGSDKAETVQGTCVSGQSCDPELGELGYFLPGPTPPLWQNDLGYMAASISSVLRLS
jgi:hypothetical protein